MCQGISWFSWFSKKRQELGGMEYFAGWVFLLGGGNLAKRDFDYLNILNAKNNIL